MASSSEAYDAVDGEYGRAIGEGVRSAGSGDGADGVKSLDKVGSGRRTPSANCRPDPGRGCEISMVWARSGSGVFDRRRRRQKAMIITRTAATPTPAPIPALAATLKPLSWLGDDPSSVFSADDVAPAATAELLVVADGTDD